MLNVFVSQWRKNGLSGPNLHHEIHSKQHIQVSYVEAKVCTLCVMTICQYWALNTNMLKIQNAENFNSDSNPWI